MSVLKFSDIIIFGVDVLKTTVNAITKTITAQIGDVVSQSVTSQDAEWWQHVGFASRPPAPSAGVAACQTVALRRSDRDACIASRDLRGLALYGALGDGETCVYAPGPSGTGQARVLLKGNGNAAIFTLQGNAPGGSPVTIQANATDGSVQMANQYGAISIGPSKLTLVYGNTAIQLDGTTVAIIAPNIALNGASVSVGANAVQPVCWGPAGISAIGSTSVKVAI